MPTEVGIDTPVGPVCGRSDGGILRFGGVPYAHADRWARAGADHVDRAVRRDAAGRGAATGCRRPRPRTGDDACPAGRAVPHRGDLDARARRSPPGDRVGARWELPDRRRFVAHVRRQPAGIRVDRGRRLQLSPRGARLARRRRRAHQPRSARPRGRGRVGARHRAGLRRRSRPDRAHGRVGGCRRARPPARDGSGPCRRGDLAERCAGRNARRAARGMGGGAVLRRGRRRRRRRAAPPADRRGARGTGANGGRRPRARSA